MLQGALESANALRAMDTALQNTARAYDGAQLAGAYRDPASSSIRAAMSQPIASSVHLPSALGPGPQSPLGEFAEFVQDALAAIGVALPDADTGKIGAAEAAWVDLGSSLRRIRSEVDSSLHAAVSDGVPQRIRIASCRDAVARRIGDAASSADAMASFARALGDAVAKAWEEIGWLLAQMAAEIAIEIGVGVLLSSVTFGAGAVATIAKIAFTVARWAVRIAEVCGRLATVVRAALAAARLAARGGLRLATESVASGLASVAAGMGVDGVRSAVDPGHRAQEFGELLAGGLLGGAVGGAGRFGRTPSVGNQVASSVPGRMFASSEWRSLLESLPKGDQRTVRVVPTEHDLRELFTGMIEGAERLPPRGASIPDVFRHPDGTVIQWRTYSRSGGATIDIDVPGSTSKWKVHVAD
ncbi:hypothetical protein ACDF64_07780 [Agromyces sp. MMS24-JH15]|uniref:hypothetical protein n=1 Tax=Agromyces sp. MMS24-JH15 TaxID=3243765 RepID=UPI003749F7FD